MIPEKVYLADIESTSPAPFTARLPGEKRLLQVVRDPENVTLGAFANSVKQAYERINQA